VGDEPLANGEELVAAVPGAEPEDLAVVFGVVVIAGLDGHLADGPVAMVARSSELAVFELGMRSGP
jgi:hypothetical protein